MPYTFTTPSNCYYIQQIIRKSDDSAITLDELNTIMLNEGSTALPYEPYGKVWYIEKQTGRYNIDTSQITLRSYSNLDYAVFSKSTDYVGYGKYQDNPVYCNKATYLLNWTADDSTNINKINAVFSNNFWWLGFPNDTTLDDMKSALDGGYIIYQLATPTYTTITNTELINQLESLNNAKSQDGTTNINVTSEDLSMILNVSVIKGDA